MAMAGVRAMKPEDWAYYGVASFLALLIAVSAFLAGYLVGKGVM
jgi:hypothetical protein